jgi:hypothetical protein
MVKKRTRVRRPHTAARPPQKKESPPRGVPRFSSDPPPADGAHHPEAVVPKVGLPLKTSSLFLKMITPGRGVASELRCTPPFKRGRNENSEEAWAPLWTTAILFYPPRSSNVGWSFAMGILAVLALCLSPRQGAQHPAARDLGATATRTVLWPLASQGPATPQHLRHSASHALDRGAPLSLIAGTLGHANVATTSVYLHA